MFWKKWVISKSTFICLLTLINRPFKDMHQPLLCILHRNVDNGSVRGFSELRVKNNRQIKKISLQISVYQSFEWQWTFILCFLLSCWPTFPFLSIKIFSLLKTNINLELEVAATGQCCTSTSIRHKITCNILLWWKSGDFIVIYRGLFWYSFIVVFKSYICQLFWLLFTDHLLLLLFTKKNQKTYLNFLTQLFIVKSLFKNIKLHKEYGIIVGIGQAQMLFFIFLSYVS